MAVAATDIKHRYSGGVGNTSAAACLGGVLSTAAGGTIDDSVANDLWDDVSAAEALAGRTEYRGFYIKNEHATDPLTAPAIYISAQPAISEQDVGIAVEAVSVTMATIANETTAPTSVVFSRPSTYGTGLALNGGSALAAGAFRGVWAKRTVNAASSSGAQTYTYKVEGTTV